MNICYQEIIEESIRLELNAAALYMLFFEQFPQDSEFWWKLVIEENNHAALLKSIRDYFQEAAGFPENLFAESAEDLRKANSAVEEMISNYKESRPTREEALNSALSLEETAGEVHFQEFAAGNADDSISRVFRQLNGEDKDHSLRIREYMEENGIPVGKDIQS
jgi:hypothetical protein